jgi:uncharacterized protein YndB with AHSA1/START domain
MPKMPNSLRICRQRLIRAPIDRVWSVVGDFGHEDRWARNIRQSSRDTSEVGVGTIRTLTLARPLMGRNRVEEAIIAVEPSQLLAYQLRGGAGPFASAESHWRLQTEDGGTLVAVEGRFVPRNALLGFLVGGVATAAVRRTLDGTLHELAAYAESGVADDDRETLS